MTNEEFTEEIYYEAHANGFINELRNKIDELKRSIDTHKLPYNEIVYKAYYSVKCGEINHNP